jgi:hypothetical protein
MKRTLALFTAALLAATAAPPPSSAQSSDDGAALGVARISLTNGDVTTKRGDSGDWVAASVNTPLVEGDVVETGPGSRVEIQLDYSNLIRLDGSSTLEIAELGDRQFRVRLLDGRATYSELRGGEADVDIETPFVAVRPRENGRYEIETRPGETVLQVRRGEAEVASPDGVKRVKKGDMLVIRQDENGNLDMREARDEPSGEWDEWNERRDERLSKSESYKYVSRSVTGADDLDYYGDWDYTSGYGNVWYPRVNAGWTPYRDGRWTWVDYYGWSWVGYEPWGWAPYHYGRWFHHPNRGWGWWPGARHGSYRWRPALVAFFGYSGRNFSVGVGFGYGNVGWVPLAPYETYYPWYGRGGYGGGYGGGRRGGHNTIIVDNSVNIYNNYRNARIHNGVTVVDANGFSRGQINNPRSLRGEELQRASLMRGQIPVVPERGSQGHMVNRSARGDSVAARAANVRTYSRAGNGVRTANARPERGSFDQQRSQVATSLRDFRSNPGAASSGVRGGDRGTAGSVRSGAPSSARGGVAETGARGSVRSSGNDSGWRSAGDPARNSTGSVRTPSSTPRTPGVDSSSSRVNRSDAVGSSSRTAAAPNRSRTDSSTRSLPERSTSRVDRGSASTSDRDASQPIVRSRSGSSFPSSGSSRVDRGGGSSSRSTPSVPQRSSSRVDRSSSSGGGRGPSTVIRSRSSSPSPSPSRVDRSGGSSRSAPSVPQRSSSRVDRSSSGSNRGSSPLIRSRSGNSAPSRSSSRVDRSPSVSPSRAPSSSRPSMSAPQRSRSSAPSMRSAPSRGGGGSVSRPSRSSAPSVRSAPSRSSSGGSVRSAPSRSRSGGRQR